MRPRAGARRRARRAVRVPPAQRRSPTRSPRSSRAGWASRRVTWTDDTAMARNLWRSLAERGRLDTDDVLRRHLDWLATDPPDVGTLTRRVLGRHPGRRPGCGGAVRVGARAGGLGRERLRDVLRAARSLPSGAPGAAPRGGAGALRDHALGRALPHGVPGGDARRRGAGPGRGASGGGRESGGKPCSTGREERSSSTSSRRRGERDRSMGPTWASRSSPRGSGSRWRPRACPSRKDLRYVVSLGGDTDTNAAVTGALLGALHGREALPGAWLEKLVDRQAIEAEAEALAGAATA